MAETVFTLRPVGFVRSPLRRREDAPNQGDGAPDAWIDIEPAFAAALAGIADRHDLVVITWLHQSDRTVLETQPEDRQDLPLNGVFATR